MYMLVVVVEVTPSWIVDLSRLNVLVKWQCKGGVPYDASTQPRLVRRLSSEVINIYYIKNGNK